MMDNFFYIAGKGADMVFQLQRQGRDLGASVLDIIQLKGLRQSLRQNELLTWCGELGQAALAGVRKGLSDSQPKGGKRWPTTD